MIYDKARKIAEKAHKGQFRFDGKTPYITHPIAVARYFDDDLRKAVAVLHDVIEDTNITAEDLLAQGIPKRVVELVEILTRRPKENYDVYVNRVIKDPTAMQIKVADMDHNLKTATNPKTRKKYENTYILLLEKIEEETVRLTR